MEAELIIGHDADNTYNPVYGCVFIFDENQIVQKVWECNHNHANGNTPLVAVKEAEKCALAFAKANVL